MRSEAYEVSGEPAPVEGPSHWARLRRRFWPPQPVPLPLVITPN